MDDVIAEFSSRGPTIDGLSKPDLVAPGVGITSLISDTSYLPKKNSGSAGKPGKAALAEPLGKPTQGVSYMDLRTLPFTLMSWIQFVAVILLLVFVPIWFFRKARFFEQKLSDLEAKLDDLSKK